MQDQAQIILSYEVSVSSDLNFWKDESVDTYKDVTFVFPQMFIPLSVPLTSFSTRAPPFFLFFNLVLCRRLRFNYFNLFLCL